MFHHILVATDGSTLSNLALPYAADLARHYGSALTLLYVVPPVPESAYEGSFTYVYNPEKRARQLEEAERIIQDALAQLDYPGTETIKSTDQGASIAEIIVSEVRQAHADLVVMSTHGRTGFAHLFQGSVAEAVMHKLDVPVFLVRAPASLRLLRAEKKDSPQRHPFH
jgi:nucleotide-binding universal stress UspA family protein